MSRRHGRSGWRRHESDQPARPCASRARRATTFPSRCGCAGTSGSGCWPRRVGAVPGDASSAATRSSRSGRRTTASELEPDTHTGDQVAVTGRVIFLRNTGKLCFVRLREGDGTELQVMLSLADVGEESLAAFKALVDLGDLLAVHGRGGHQPPRRAVGAGDRVVDRGQDAATAAQRAQAALRRGPGAAALRRHDGASRGPRHGAHQGRRAARACAPRSTAAASSRSRRRSSSSPTAVPRPGRSAPTSTRSTRTCCCGSRSSST